MTEPLSALDVAWLHMETDVNPMVITALVWLEAPLPAPVFEALVRERLVERYPRFSQRVVDHALRGPCWEAAPDFDLGRHVTHTALPPPGGRSALQALVADRMSTPLDMSRSPWHFEVVADPRGRSAVVCRIHHVIADGISLARVLLDLTREHPDPDGLVAPADRAPLALDGAASLLDDLGRAIADPAALLEAVGVGADAVMEAERLVRLPADPPTSLRRPLTVRKVAAWADPIPLDAVKAIGRQTGTTVNDVLVSVLAGALHTHLHASHTPADTVRAFVPVNLRPLDRPVPRTLGNAFTAVLLPLPVGRMRPIERLYAVHHTMAALKSGPQAEVVWAFLHILGASPELLERVLVDIVGRKGSLVVTNVPGPREPLVLAGVGVDGVLVWVPQTAAVGLGVSIFSYANEVTVGVCGDASVLPDPDGFVARFEASWAALSALSAQ
jgi:WS/DGAT/MGAT family acyltransferase